MSPQKHRLREVALSSSRSCPGSFSVVAGTGTGWTDYCRGTGLSGERPWTGEGQWSEPTRHQPRTRTKSPMPPAGPSAALQCSPPLSRSGCLRFEWRFASPKTRGHSCGLLDRRMMGAEGIDPWTCMKEGPAPRPTQGHGRPGIKSKKPFHIKHFSPYWPGATRAANRRRRKPASN